jgi:hypothetical protein
VIAAFLTRYALAAALIAAVLGWAGAGVQTVRLRFAARDVEAAKAETVALQGRWNKQTADLNAQALQLSEAERSLDAARAVAQQKGLEHEALKTAEARADADAARTALDRLRQRAASADAARDCRAPGSDPAIAASGASAGAAGGMPADDVLRRLGEAARQLAAYADATRNAGQLCESDYDALTVK